MTTPGSYPVGVGAASAAGLAAGAAKAPDEDDRRAVDDNWIHAEGELCAKCGRELTVSDFIRRSATGTWVHETCPSDDR